MPAYVDSIEFVTLQCAECGMAYAITKAFEQKRRNDKKTLFCPVGHSQWFPGETEAQKLQKEVERQKQMREAEEARRLRVETERDQVARAHHRMRVRVMNGVCPCCNRTFQNLMAHMKTEHAGEFNLRTLRTAFGMSQGALAEEIGVTGNHVSQHERGKPVPPYVKQAIESWIDRQACKANQ